MFFEPWQPCSNSRTLRSWYLKSIPIFEDLRKEWHLKNSFLQRCFAGQAILEGQSCIEYEFKCAFYVYICNVCMSRYLARRQFSYASMDLPLALSPLPYPSLFSFFNRFFFRRHRTASLSANSAEEAMWEFICPTSTLVLLLHSCHPLLSSAFYSFGDLRLTHVTDFPYLAYGVLFIIERDRLQLTFCFDVIQQLSL